MKLGIGVPTYNRAASLKRCLDSISRYSSESFVGVVADDGSADETKDMTHPDFTFLHCENGGIARNKNRLLYRLFEIEKCDVVLLIEDDVEITDPDVMCWVAARSLMDDHINHRPKADDSDLDFDYSKDFGGWFSGYSRKSIDAAGYMDPHFQGYGYEHVEHTWRLIRHDYGGIIRDGVYLASTLGIDGFTIDSGIPSTVKPGDIERNHAVLVDAMKDTSYKHPWLDEADRIKFLSEVEK